MGSQRVESETWKLWFEKPLSLTLRIVDSGLRFILPILVLVN